MALITCNPSDDKCAPIGCTIINVLHTCFSITVTTARYLWDMLSWFEQIQQWLTVKFGPSFINYYFIRAQLFFRSTHLSWNWWLIIITAHWQEPPLRPGKFNGTYWMHHRADKFELLAQFKEIDRERKQLDAHSLYAAIFSEAWFHIIMMFLNFCGIAYFTMRILLFKFGWLTMHINSKQTWSKRRRFN